MLAEKEWDTASFGSASIPDLADEEWYILSPSVYSEGDFASEDEDGYISIPDVYSSGELSKENEGRDYCDNLQLPELDFRPPVDIVVPGPK